MAIWRGRDSDTAPNRMKKDLQSLEIFKLNKIPKNTWRYSSETIEQWPGLKWLCSIERFGVYVTQFDRLQ